MKIIIRVTQYSNNGNINKNIKLLVGTAKQHDTSIFGICVFRQLCLFQNIPMTLYRRFMSCFKIDENKSEYFFHERPTINFSDPVT